jgi:hypothetical protein
VGTAATVVLVALAVVAGILVLMYLGVFLAGASQAWESRGFERKAAKGWEKVREDPSLTSRFQGGPFGVGRDHTATNVYRGLHDGRRFVAFDLALTDDLTGHDPIRREYAVVALELGRPTPPVSVHRTESPVPLFAEADGEEVVVDRREPTQIDYELHLLASMLDAVPPTS